MDTNNIALSPITKFYLNFYKSHASSNTLNAFYNTTTDPNKLKAIQDGTILQYLLKTGITTPKLIPPKTFIHRQHEYAIPNFIDNLPHAKIEGIDKQYIFNTNTKNEIYDSEIAILKYPTYIYRHEVYKISNEYTIKSYTRPYYETCPLCLKTFFFAKRKRYWQTDSFTVHVKRCLLKHPCPKCNITFKRLSEKRNHNCTLKRKKLYPCKQCKAKFTFKTNYYRHMCTIHKI